MPRSSKKRKTSKLSTISEDASNGDEDGEDASKSKNTEDHTGQSMVVPIVAKQIAASRLLRLWRKEWKYLSSKIYAKQAFDALSIEHVKSISFEALVVFLREKPIIAVVKRCLQRIHLLTTFRHGSPRRALAPEHVNVRVFMAGYMIAYRPTHVFESMGALEQSLYEAALPLMVKYEQIAMCIIASPNGIQDVPYDVTDGFPAMLLEYFKRFKAWKVPDEAKLTCRIKHALIALYQAEGHLPTEEPEDSKLRVEFCTQITRLRGKLQQIAGPDALLEFDALRKSGHSIGVSGSSAAYSALPGRMTNEQLAHELLMNLEFQLDDTGGCSVENSVLHRIRESFHQAFWDSLADDLKLAQPCYVRVLRVLAEIRDGVSDLIGKPGGDIHQIIDIEQITAQASAGAISWSEYKSLVAAVVIIIQRIQAPKRDDETRQKWKDAGRLLIQADTQPDDQPRVLCKSLEFLLDRVNAMRVDAANARLRLIAPVIKDHGIDYERGKFQDKLNDGSLSLVRTEDWICKAVKYVVAAQFVHLEDIVAGKASAFVNVHTHALTSLIFGPAIRAENVPETLLFDVRRISLLQERANYIAIGCAMIVMVQHKFESMKRENRAIHSENQIGFLDSMLDDVKGLIKESNASFADFTTTLCEKLDAIHELTNSTERAKFVGSLSAAISDPNDAVRKLMASRVESIWVKCMKSGKMPDDEDRFTTTIKPLYPLIKEAAEQAMALANMNRTVHLPTYDKVIAETARKVAGA